MMQERIAKSLLAQFEQHRIVFWSDPANEMKEVFEATNLEGVEKLEVANNEFGLKHRVLREAPLQKFLIYRSGPKPAPAANWLLDLELAYGAFKADQTAIWRTELGLPGRFDAVLSEHEEFFRSGKRLEKLKSVIRPDDSETQFRLRMMEICCGAEGGLDTVLERLLAGLAASDDSGMKLIIRVGLEGFLWKQVEALYGYRSGVASIDDLAITLFKSCYFAVLDDSGALAPEALVLFKRWKNNRTTANDFAALSERFAGPLSIEADLEKRDFRTLGDIDHFEAIDRALIRGLVKAQSETTASGSEIQTWIDQRRNGHWYKRFEDVYEAIHQAAAFHQALAQVNLGMTSLSEGVKRYASSWFRIDQHYRKFVFHMQRAGQASLMQPLFESIENHYVNNYLLRVNDAWQTHVDQAPTWSADDVIPQRNFYRHFVGEYRRKDQRICVIISDALRYEVADELTFRIRGLDRYEAKIQPMLGSLPSYTQLGMAALLPNEELVIADDATSTVHADGQSSQGIENRKKILAAGRVGDRTTALKYEDFMNLANDEARATLSGHDVIYIYHNTIDATGDKPATEDRVFDAAEDAIEDIIKLARKLTAANASNILVTADHGFIYQHRPIEESDFAQSAVVGDSILYENRRFILGHNLQAQQGLRHFTSNAAGLGGSVEMLIPKSINRLRRKGSGSRFVHGGAALQEVVVPVVTISKSRQSDTSSVDIEIVAGNKQITSGQIAVTLYQSAAVTAKVQERRLRAGLYSTTDKLISDSHELIFDQTSDNPRDRERVVRFLLSKDADAFNGKEVFLRLETRFSETSQFTVYRQVSYTLKRSFSPDFDF